MRLKSIKQLVKRNCLTDAVKMPDLSGEKVGTRFIASVVYNEEISHASA